MLHKKYLESFELSWKSFLSHLPTRYRKSSQLQIGNRLRPILVYWGYLLSCNTSHSLEDVIIQLGIGVELLHKSSIIIDDMIDEDFERHGKKTFHIEYSENESTLFSIHLLSRSYEQFLKCLKAISNNQENHLKKISLFNNTLKDMSIGALLEITSSNSDLTRINHIERIISLETVSLIRNSLLLGFYFGSENVAIANHISNIGNGCGYIFQILNDMEPFSNVEYTTNHKGKNNYDILRSRKNIVFAYIYEASNINEKKIIDTLLRNKSQLELSKSNKILELYKKYEISKSITSIVQYTYLDIQKSMIIITLNSEKKNHIIHFRKFVDYMLQKSFERLSKNDNMIFNKLLINK